MWTFFDIMDLCVQFWPEIMGIAFGKFYSLAGPGEVRREYSWGSNYSNGLISRSPAHNLQYFSPLLPFLVFLLLSSTPIYKISPIA
jgi:hypothetical protein